MAKQPLYDWLPRNSEIHNFTNIDLSEQQSRVLGMGPKFRPSLKSPTAAEFDLEIKDFRRRVCLHVLFADQPQDPNFNPRLYIPTGWNLPQEDPELEDKLFHLHKALQRNIAENQPHWKDNLSRQDRAELKELKSNQAVRVLPTDKNPGPDLMSTDWVKTETLRHLSELSYSKVTLEDWYVYRDNIIKRREQLSAFLRRFSLSLSKKQSEQKELSMQS